MSALLLVGSLFVTGPVGETRSVQPVETLEAAREATKKRAAPPARRSQPGFSDPFGGQTEQPSVVFGDPFATPEARHRPYEPQNVHAQFDDSPQRWKNRRARRAAGWGYGWGYGWGLGASYAAVGYGGWTPYGYRRPYGYWGGPRCAWGTGVAAGVGVGVGIGLSALFF